jgi:hypothetical protein
MHANRGGVRLVQTAAVSKMNAAIVHVGLFALPGFFLSCRA